MASRIAVLGGGVAGISASHHLAALGCQVHLLERTDRLGGLLQSVEHDGLAFDVGAFLLPGHHELFASFPSIRELFVPVRPRQLIYPPRGAPDVYPLSLRGYLHNYGLPESVHSLLDLLYCKVSCRRQDTLPTFLKYCMGGRIYRNSGLKNYVERLYGLPDHMVALQFSERTIVRIRSRLPTRVLRARVMAAGRRLRGIPPPVRLARPESGFPAVYERIHEQLLSDGVEVRLGCAVDAVRREGEGYRVWLDGKVEEFDLVVSTLPIPVMLRLVGAAPDMEFDNLHLLSLFYRGRVRPGGSALYNFSAEGRWKRITVFSRYYGRKGGTDYLTVEVSTRDISPPSLQALREDFERHAAGLGMFEGRPEYVGDQVTPRAYPVFRVGDPERVAAERAKLARYGIPLIGRQGDHVYLSSQGVAQRAAALAAQVGRDVQASGNA